MQRKTKKKSSEANRRLRTFMQNLRHCEYYDAKRRIVQACGVSLNVFNNWMNDKTAIPADKAIIINEVLNKQVI